MLRPGGNPRPRATPGLLRGGPGRIHDQNRPGIGVCRRIFFPRDLRREGDAILILYKTNWGCSPCGRGHSRLVEAKIARRSRKPANPIDVQDEWGGLPPGDVEDLFRPYEQRGDDRTGMGLGLSISRKGVQANG
jgi:hypothetical protein